MKRRITPPLLVVLVLANTVVWSAELKSRPGLVERSSFACAADGTGKSASKAIEAAFADWGNFRSASVAKPRTRIPCDCSDCVQGPYFFEFHCERIPMNDCGQPWNWFDDDHQWRSKYHVMTCPDGQQYRLCEQWQKVGCCNFGAQVAPPGGCDPLNGRDPCSSRSTPCPNVRIPIP